MNTQTPIERVRWLAAKSSASDQIPAFGLVRITGVDTTDAQGGTFQIAKPNADNQDCFINGPTPIAIGDYGAITVDVPFMALYETGDGTPTVDSVWGVASGGYKLRSGKTGFVIKGVVDSVDGIAMVMKQSGGGGGSSSITVKESDGSPICSGLDTIIIDASKMTVTCNGDGSATITVKTHSQTVATGAGSVTCNGDGTITLSLTTVSVEVVG